MGTSIELTVSYVSLDYAKNFMGIDYGFLFRDGDLTRRQSDAINYEYYREHPNEASGLADHELAFVRPLSQVLSRLCILGYSLERARAEYDAILEEAFSMEDTLGRDEDAKSHLTFEEFCALANRYPLASLASEYIDLDSAERNTVAQGRFAADAIEFSRLPWTEKSGSYWSESSYLSSELCILSVPSMLQVFGMNPENTNAEVIWQFGPIVNAGWVDRDAFYPGARRRQAILVVTEGASDARILRRALDILRPDVADFFRFIDGEERHHFWGTGNLVKFAEGLQRIDIQNKVLLLLDNDAEGVDAYQKLRSLKMPVNMRSMLLPDIDELRNFPALGPQGLNNCDINGRAAAIECYLDLNLSKDQSAQVIWSNYKKDVNAWHGALEHKEAYAHHFMNQSAQNLSTGTYDTSKLARLLDAMIAEASLLHDAK